MEAPHGHQREYSLRFLQQQQKGFRDMLSDRMTKTFRIDAVGLMNSWFSYGTNAMPGSHRYS
jgi:hypothetical protein